MTKYILHGGYTSVDNEWNKSFYKELSKDLPEGGPFLLVYFASEDENVQKNFKQDRERIFASTSVKDLNIELAIKEDFSEKLKKASGVYLRGGDTSKLYATLTNFPEFKESLEGKTVAGSSAGAYVLSTYFFSNSRGKVFEGFGCVPVRTICHFESDRHPMTGNPLEEMEKYPHNLELVLLKDTEWRAFTF